jgi:hypothetical protein
MFPTFSSEWLLFNANSAIVQLYHGENWNNSPRIGISPHIIPIPSQTVYALSPQYYVLWEATNTNFSLWFDPTGARTHDLLQSRRAR